MKLGIVFVLGILLVSLMSMGSEPEQCCPFENGPGEWSTDVLGRRKCVPATGVCKTSNVPDHKFGGQCTTPEGLPGKFSKLDESGVLECAADTGQTLPTTTPTAKPCVSEEEKEACTNAAAEAISGCGFVDDLGIKNADAALHQIAQGLAAKVRSDETPGGTNAACSTLGKATTGLNAAIAAFDTTCSGKREACLNGCRTVRERELECVDKEIAKISKTSDPADLARRKQAREEIFQEYNEKILSCQKLDAKIGQARQALSDSIQSAKQMSTCKEQTESPGTGDEYCKARPNDLGCQAKLAQDCSNPSYAAANRICSCVGANQHSEACRLAQKALGSDAIASGGLGVGGAGAGGKTSGLNLGEENGPPDEFKMNPVAYGEDPGGAKGGHGFSGSGGGNPLGGGPGARGGGLPPEEKPGGFMSGNPAGGAGGGFLSGISSAVKQLLGGPEKKEMPLSLDKFRPDLKKPLISMRGLAGATGPDGITGPNSDIWLKVKNQYHLQLFTFILTP